MLFVGVSLIGAEAYRSSRSQSKRRDNVDERLDDLKTSLVDLQTMMDRLRAQEEAREQFEDGRSVITFSPSLDEGTLIVSLQGGPRLVHTFSDRVRRSARRLDRPSETAISHSNHPFSELPLLQQHPPFPIISGRYSSSFSFGRRAAKSSRYRRRTSACVLDAAFVLADVDAVGRRICRGNDRRESSC